MTAETRSAVVKWSAIAYIVACLVVALTGCQPQSPATVGATGTTAPPTPTEIIDADNGSEIVNDFIANTIGGERKWIGKRVRIKSAVTGIGKDKHGLYVTLYHVSVYPSPAEMDKFGGVRRNDLIEVEATLVRYDLRGAFPHIDGEDGRLVHVHRKGPQP